MKDISVGVVVALCALSALSASTGLGDAVKIDWSESVDLGPGGYARVHRLADGRFMAAYSAGGSFTTMRGESTPPGMVFGRDRGLWNSLCPLDGDRFLLVTEQNGRITLYLGSVSAK